MSTVARSLKGTLVGGLGFLMKLVQIVAVVPLMLHGWGASQYALWIACQAALSMLVTLDTGHQAYVGNELTKTVSVDLETTRVVLGSALRFALVLGMVEVSVVIALWVTHSVGSVLGVSHQVADQHRLHEVMLLLAASWVAVGSIGGVFARLYPATGQFARGELWMLVQNLMTAVLAALAAFFGQSLFVMALWMSMATLAFGAAYVRDSRMALSKLRPFLSRGDFVTGARNFTRSLPLTASNMLVQFQGNGLLLLVSALYGATNLVAFGTLRTLSNALVQATATIFHPAVPELVRLRVTGEHGKLRVGLFSLTVFTTPPAACGAMLLAAFGEPLYAVWTRHKIEFDRGLFHVFAAAAVWKIFGSPFVNQLLAMNRVRSIGIWAFSQTATLFAVAALLLRLFGLPGFAGGILAGEIVGSVLLPMIWVYRDLPTDERPSYVRDQLVAATTPALTTIVLVSSIATSLHTGRVILAVGIAACLISFQVQYRRVPEHMREQAARALRALLRGRTAS